MVANATNDLSAAVRRPARSAQLASCLAVAAALRLALSLVSIGSNDARIWQQIGWSVQSNGLIGAYRAHTEVMNHPIPPVLWAWGVTMVFPPGWFYFVMRLPAIAADLLSVNLLSRRSPAAMWTMALNPVAILISGYHGSTDSIYAAFSLLAALELHERRFFRGGLALAAGINIKLVPALFILPALSLCRRRRQGARLVSGLAIGIVPYLPLIIRPMLLWRTMLHYGGAINRWGVVLLLDALVPNSISPNQYLQAVRLYSYIGRGVIILAVAAFSGWAWWKQQWSAPRRFLTAAAIFLFVAPGFGIQYLIVLLPLLMAVDLRTAWRLSLPASIFLLIIYAHGLLPSGRLESLVGDFPMSAALFGWLAWWMIGALLLDAAKDRSTPFGDDEVRCHV